MISLVTLELMAKVLAAKVLAAKALVALKTWVIFFGDIFGDFMGGGGRRGRGGPRAMAGEDLQETIEVSFEEAAFGIEKEISINRMELKPGSTPQTCDMCQGHGQIRRQQGFFTISQTCPKCGGAGQSADYVKKKVSLSVKIPSWN
jgi:molecular chaperone DnaJ